jgi:hypothetical protein
MKPFRKNVAIAIDGGGIRGAVVTRCLELLELHLGQPVGQIFRLAAGTSTGAIIAAGIATGHTATEMHALYNQLGAHIFRRTLRSRLWPLTRYRYPLGPLEEALRATLGTGTLGEIWSGEDRHDLILTAFDLTTNHTRFIKPWKAQYVDWPLARAVAASCAVPTYFPPVEGRYVDGGVGAYSNPCYLAAYEIAYYLNWKAADTTLISLGTGRAPHSLTPSQARRFYAWDWIGPVLGAFLQSADDQQVHLVSTFFPGLDFRRFQVDLDQPYGMDDAAHLPRYTYFGELLWDRMLNDVTDPIQELRAGHLWEREGEGTERGLP